MEKLIMKMLVVAPHPDDDVISMGGTILRNTEVDNIVDVVYMASTPRREAEAIEAGKLLGVSRQIFLHLPDGVLADIIVAERGYSQLYEMVKNYDVIFGPNQYESHMDHWATWEVLDAVNCNPVQYEVWSPLMKPQDYIDITPYAGIKWQAIRCHRSQLTNCFEEATLALNRWRGIMSGKGIYFAEAFTR